MRRTIFKVFEFIPDLKSEYDASDWTKVSLSLYPDYVSLKDDRCYYPTDADVWFKTDLFNPQALTTWISIQPEVVNPTVAGETKTEIKFKLNNGTDDYFWNGVAWAVAGVSDWTSMTDLQANFAAFTAVSEKKLAIVANLKTNDTLYTPKLIRILVAFEARVGSWVEEYLYDSLFPELEEIMYDALDMDWAIDWGGGTTMDLSGYVTESGYTFRNWLEVYDFDGDPERETDLLDNYDPNTGVLTLNASVAEGTRLFALVVPNIELAVSTDADWYAVSKIPQIIFRDYSKLFAGWNPDREAVVNYDTAEAIAMEGPRRTVLDIPVDIITDRAMPQPRIMELFQYFAEVRPIVTTKGVGAKYRFAVNEDASFFPRGNEEGTLRGVLRIRLENCQEWYFAPTNEHAIKQVEVDGLPSPTDC